MSSSKLKGSAGAAWGEVGAVHVAVCRWTECLCVGDWCIYSLSKSNGCGGRCGKSKRPACGTGCG